MKITPEDILKQVKLSGKVPEIIEQIVNRKIILDTARKLEIEVETEELQIAADRFRLINRLDSASQTYQWLEKRQLSVELFEEMLFYRVISSKLISHLFADKIELYFRDKQLDYTGIVMYEIVLDDESLAIKLFNAIQNKEISFFEAARQYIRDVELRRKLGYRGILYRQDLKPEIAAVVFVAHPPQVLKPIETAEGFSLIWLEEKLKPELDSHLADRIGTDLFAQWLKQKNEVLVNGDREMIN